VLQHLGKNERVEARGGPGQVERLDVADDDFREPLARRLGNVTDELDAGVAAGAAMLQREGTRGAVAAADLEHGGAGIARQARDEIGARGREIGFVLRVVEQGETMRPGQRFA
jgi:hypothetical protein